MKKTREELVKNNPNGQTLLFKKFNKFGMEKAANENLENKYKTLKKLFEYETFFLNKNIIFPKDLVFENTDKYGFTSSNFL